MKKIKQLHSVLLEKEPIEVRVFIYLFFSSVLLSIALATLPKSFTDYLFGILVNGVVFASFFIAAFQKIFGSAQLLVPVYRLMYGITGIDRFKQLYNLYGDTKDVDTK